MCIKLLLIFPKNQKYQKDFYFSSIVHFVCFLYLAKITKRFSLFCFLWFLFCSYHLGKQQKYMFVLSLLSLIAVLKISENHKNVFSIFSWFSHVSCENTTTNTFFLIFFCCSFAFFKKILENYKKNRSCILFHFVMENKKTKNIFFSFASCYILWIVKMKKKIAFVFLV